MAWKDSWVTSPDGHSFLKLQYSFLISFGLNLLWEEKYFDKREVGGGYPLPGGLAQPLDGAGSVPLGELQVKVGWFCQMFISYNISSWKNIQLTVSFYNFCCCDL